MDRWNVNELLALRPEDERTYEEVFRAHELSIGLSVWPEGQPDEQKPHAEDEVYYVIEGRGVFRVGGDDEPVEQGSVIYVSAHAEHHFHSIEKTLKVLVLWARLTIRASPSIRPA